MSVAQPILNIAAALAQAVAREGWMDRARCRGRNDDAFFAETPSDGRTGGRIMRAKSHCGRCEVRRACLEFAYASTHSMEYGIYGGTTEAERRRYGTDTEGLLALHAIQVAAKLPVEKLSADVLASLAGVKESLERTA